MEPFIEKVTVFITRKVHKDNQLLLFKHPHAGIQIPAGTVESEENVEKAALREAKEETNISEFTSVELIGTNIEKHKDGNYSICKEAYVYSRPTKSSFNWIEIRRGIRVKELRQQGGFKQISYIEYDNYPENEQISYQIIGWIPQESLVGSEKRYFYHLKTQANTQDEWDVQTDNYVIQLFWVSLDKLPSVIKPQNKWFDFLPKIKDI